MLATVDLLRMSSGFSTPPGRLSAVNDRPASHEALGAETSGSGQLDQPLLVRVQGVKGGQRCAFAKLGLGGDLAAYQPAPASHLLRAGVLHVGEDVRAVLGHRQVDIDGAPLGAGRGPNRRAHAQAGHIGGQQQVALGLGHVEGLHAPELLGVPLHRGLGRADVAADPDVDHMGLDDLEHEGPAGDPLFGDLDPRQHTTVLKTIWAARSRIAQITETGLGLPRYSA